MKRPATAALKKVLARMGYRINRVSAPVLADIEETVAGVMARVSPYTMTSAERVYGLIQAVDYVCHNRLAGDFVECGVWRGGSAMAMAEQLSHRGHTDCTLWLYDTFSGMTPPAAVDVSRQGQRAVEKFRRLSADGQSSQWCRVGLEAVQANMAKTPFPANRIRYVEGKVEDTLPSQAPERIALLRLDTDWYASTKHELEHLYPRLVSGGVLIVDDYGEWQGCRRAVDEYFSQLSSVPLLNRIDHTCRLAVKP